MIYRLRKKFIGICIISFVFVCSVVLALIFIINTLQVNRDLDMVADIIVQYNGKLPDFDDIVIDQDRPPMPNGFNKESPFTTRYFTVYYDENNSVMYADTVAVAGISNEESLVLAQKVMSSGNDSGWCGDYRFNIYNTENGKTIVFVNGGMSKTSNKTFLLTLLMVFAVCSVIIILLIVGISKRAVKPAVESYEKQKQFITNANHELKTPITLIRTNLDILESEIGQNEWLTDIRDETLMMSELVNQMVSLAHMDEDGMRLKTEQFNLSEAVADTAADFAANASALDKTLTLDIKENIMYVGNEELIRRVVSVLLDNAVKYCDAGGDINVKLSGGKHPELTVKNTYAFVNQIELNRLFDRFYRADKARTYGTGFGIGLSIAKSIVEKHRGSISACSVDNEAILFKVNL